MDVNQLTPPTQAKPRTARLFFAIWPRGRTREQLDAAAQYLHAACGGRRAKRETIHITLVFLGDVPVERIDELRGLAEQVKAKPFDLVLGKLGWWKHNRVAWAAPEETPEAMGALVHDLEEALKERGFQFDARPYVPHATLARKADCREAVTLDMPIAWPVKEFVLVRSATSAGGAAYEVIGRWPL